MATTTSFDSTLTADKTHFVLRKLHSLTGIIPLGCFLLEHMLTNSRAFGWFGLFQSGPGSFNDAVHFLHSLPFLLFLEIFGIFLPLAFHAIYGIVIALQGKSNVSAYANWDNRRYALQRLTGYFTVLFVIVHLLKFRFAHVIGWGPEYIGSPDPFEVTRNGMMHWAPWGFVIPVWFTFAFYWLGLAAACFHFANGLWSFCITWGIAIGPRAQKGVLAIAMLIGLAMFSLGSAGLIGLRYPAKADAAHAAPVVAESLPQIEGGAAASVSD